MADSETPEAHPMDMPSLALLLGRSGCCLVVEDDSLIRLDIEETLRQLGSREVEGAASAKKGAAIASSIAVGLAVLDIDLGDHTSFELAATLDAAKVPVLFLTGYGSNVPLPDRLSGVPVLGKPFTTKKLAEYVLLAIRRHDGEEVA